MSFKTRVALLKEFPEGYGIGYGRTFITRRPTRIATIPVGYGDGLGWVLSNQGEALIRGKKASIVGRISMDMSTLDVSGIPDCAEGDEVVLMGAQGKETITAEEIAARSHSISYEVLCALGKRAPRIFVRNGEPERVEPRLRRIFIPGEEHSIARIDGIIRSCFQARAQNDELGDAIFSEMFEILFGKNDRRLDLRSDFCYDVVFSHFTAAEIAESPERADFFKVTTHIEYVKELREVKLIIACAFDQEQLDALFENSLCEYRWLLNRKETLDGDIAFVVKDLRIDGRPLALLKNTVTDKGLEALYGSEELKEKIGSAARFKIEIETRQRKDNRFFSAYIVYPTRGMRLSFHYGDTGISNVRDLNFFSGRRHAPETVRIPGRSVTMSIPGDTWIFPTSGVAFFWDVTADSLLTTEP
jgi:alanine racemase